MSVATVTSRIDQIQALIAAANGAPPAAPRSSAAVAPAASSFATQLASATSGAAAPAPASGTGGPYDQQIRAAAAKYGIDPAVLHGLIQQESGFDPNATSSAGAVGLAQLLPSTAAALGVSNPSDPAQSIDAGAHYLRQQLDTFGGDIAKALAAYNAGPGAVQRYGGVPPYGETQDYVRKVLAYADQYRSQAASAATPTPNRA